MTQYTDEVAAVLRRQQVEKWSNGTQYIAAQDGYVETALNNGSITREYHRDFGEHKAGDKVFIQEGRPWQELLDEAPMNITLIDLYS